MTVPERILAAAATFGLTAFSAEELVVRCWKMFPEEFGLQGYSEVYPDSNRVFTKIMGKRSPLRANGWLVKIASKRYRLTDAGRVQAATLSEAPQQAASAERLGGITRSAAVVLRRLVNSRVVEKYRSGEERFSFSDACEFWNISPRSNAGQLAARLAEVDGAISAAGATSTSDLVALPGGQQLTRETLQILREIADFLRERFASELEVIRRRADERRR